MSTNKTNASAEQRLKDLGIPASSPTPLGAYVEAVQSGNLLFLSARCQWKEESLSSWDASELS